MKAKDKAKELVDKFYNLQSSIAWDTTQETKEKASIFNDELGPDVELYWHELAKQTAVISIDELLLLVTYQPTIDYWNEVKQEISQL
jgi:hypothetical protein